MSIACAHGDHGGPEQYQAITTKEDMESLLNEIDPVALRNKKFQQEKAKQDSNNSKKKLLLNRKSIRQRLEYHFFNGLFMAFRWVLKVYIALINLGAVAHGGISYLAMVEILTVAAATFLIVSLGPVSIPLIAGLVGMVCAIESMSLSVPTAQGMIQGGVKEIEKNFDPEDPKASFLKILPHWRSLIPTFLWPALWFKLFYTLSKWPEDVEEHTRHHHNHDHEHEHVHQKKSSEKLNKRQKWLIELHHRSWISVLLDPIVCILGPIAEGAEIWMGLIPILFFMGLAGSASGGLLPLGYIICILGFAVAATSNYALSSRKTINVLNKGFKGLKNTFKELFTFNILDEHGKPIYIPQQRSEEYFIDADDAVTTPEGYVILLIDGKPLLNEDGEFFPITQKSFARMMLRPLFNKQGKRILYDDLGHPIINSNGKPVLAESLELLYYRQGMPVLESDNKPVLDEGHLILIKPTKSVLSADAKKQVAISNFVRRVKNKDIHSKPLKKGLFKTIMPASLGLVVWSAGPLVIAGTAFLGVMTMFSGPWVPIVAGLVALVAGLQNICLDGNAAFEMLKKIGKGIDQYFQNIQNKYRNHRGIKAKFKAVIFAILPNIKRFIPDLFLKVGVSLFNIKDHKLNEKTWLRCCIDLFLGLLAEIIGIFGPIAHGADGFRSSQPIFIAIFLIFLSTGVAAFPPALMPAILALASIAFVVAMIQNRALEVTAAQNKLVKLGDKIEAWFNRIFEAPRNKKISVAFGKVEEKIYGYKFDNEDKTIIHEGLPDVKDYDRDLFKGAGRYMLNAKMRNESETSQAIDEQNDMDEMMPFPLRCAVG